MLWKPDPLRSQALRQSAKGQDCTIRMPGVCCGDPATSVLAHMPFGGRGTVTKASDDHAAIACWACHVFLDNPAGWGDAAEILECCMRGMAETRALWRREGLVTYKGAK